MKNVCVLGNGQLGRMLRQAGEPLGIEVFPVGIDDSPNDVPYQDAIITAEVERWPDTPFTKMLSNHAHFVNSDTFPQLADRLSQKQLLDKLGLATSPWQPLMSPQQWSELFNSVGKSLIVKRRCGGYDGRGQWRVAHNQQIVLPEDAYGQCIVEKAIDFKEEVSLIGARNQQGRCVFYPLTHNLHQEGILRASVAFSHPSQQVQSTAEAMLSTVMHELNYIGVMAMECFVADGGLLINELAPRVHNSGHWTQNGASISQFELHLRAILDLPMPKPTVNGSTVMINLIGIDLNTDWLLEPLAHLHWYQKEVKPGRKVGHINLTQTDRCALVASLERLKPLFNQNYQSALGWIEDWLRQ